MQVNDQVLSTIYDNCRSSLLFFNFFLFFFLFIYFVLLFIFNTTLLYEGQTSFVLSSLHLPFTAKRLVHDYARKVCRRVLYMPSPRRPSRDDRERLENDERLIYDAREFHPTKFRITKETPRIRHEPINHLFIYFFRSPPRTMKGNRM